MNIQTSFKQITDIVGIPLVQETLKKLTVIEAEKYALKMDKIKSEILPFEKRFNKSSRTAWNEFQSGKLGDESDIMEWMMLFENYLAIEKHYKKITEIIFK